MSARWWDRGGEALKQCEWGKREPPTGTRLGVVVRQAPGVELMQAFERRRRPRTIAWRPFQFRPVVSFDAHMGIELAPARLHPVAHHCGPLGFEPSTPTSATSSRRRTLVWSSATALALAPLASHDATQHRP